MNHAQLSGHRLTASASDVQPRAVDKLTPQLLPELKQLDTGSGTLAAHGLQAHRPGRRCECQRQDSMPGDRGFLAHLSEGRSQE